MFSYKKNELGVFINPFEKHYEVPYDGGTYHINNYGSSVPRATPERRAIANAHNSAGGMLRATRVDVEKALKEEILELPSSEPHDHSNMTHLEKLKMIFKTMLEASYMDTENAREKGKGYGLEMDEQYSNENTYVYIDMMTGYPLIVHRGSVELINDFLIEDVLILTGLSTFLSSRIEKAKQLVLQVEKKYNKQSDAFGHSLGATIAENSGAQGYILTYNKGAGLGDIRKTTNANQIDYRSRTDLVSLLSETQKTNMKYIENNDGLLYSHGLSILPDIQQRR